MVSQQSIERIKSLYGLPEYVDVDDTGVLSKQAAVNTGGVDYPTHSQGSCYLSNALFWDNAAQTGVLDKKAADEFTKLAKFFDVFEDVRENVLRKIALQEREFTEKYACSYGGENFYPLHGDKLIQKSAEAMCSDRRYLTYGLRKESATNILAAVKESGVAVPDDVRASLQKSAGIGIGVPQEIYDAIIERANSCRVLNYHENAAGLQKLAAFVAANTLDNDLCQKIAIALATTDEQTSLHTRYGRGLDMPEDVCHSIQADAIKQATDQYIKVANGEVYDIKAITPFLKAFLPPASGGMFSKKANVREFIANMNPQQIETLRIGLNLNGIEPVDYSFIR